MSAATFTHTRDIAWAILSFIALKFVYATKLIGTNIFSLESYI